MKAANRRSDRLQALTQTTPGTTMGTLLRSFWQPIALSTSVASGAARPLRVLGEDLTLFRGERGIPHLIGASCAHRCTALHTGWVQGDLLRCMYHGWRYDGMGHCTEMPAEPKAKPELIKIPGYPVREYAGLVFAFLGSGEAPEFELPRKDVLEMPGHLSIAKLQTWDCNFFQQVENSLDATHVSYVHVWGKVSRFGEEITTSLPELTYLETSAGIRQTATRGVNNVRISDWTFPNNNHVVSPGPRKGDPWLHSVVWAVPVDDHSTLRFGISTVPETSAEVNERIRADRTPDFNPADYYQELFLEHRLPPSISASQLIGTQDYVALRGQGTIADRSGERLGKSDAGVALLRKIFLRELDAIRKGGPTKQWSRLAEPAHMPIQSPDAVPA